MNIDDPKHPHRRSIGDSIEIGEFVVSGVVTIHGLAKIANDLIKAEREKYRKVGKIEQSVVVHGLMVPVVPETLPEGTQLYVRINDEQK